MTLELGQATGRKPPFKYSALNRVGFSDTDAQGIVYYGRYLPYFDQARVEYHRHLGQLSVDLDEHEFVMRASTIEYLAPARFDDLVEVFVRVARIGRTSVTYEHAAYRVEQDVLMVKARQTLVLVDLDERRAAPIPPLYRERIHAFEEDDLELTAPLTARHEQTGALEAIERVLNRGGDADDVLRSVLKILSRLYAYVGLKFVEAAELVEGPSLGRLDGEARRYPIAYQGRTVAELAVGSAAPADDPFLERVATIVSPYCLVGWDTGGAAWQP